MDPASTTFFTKRVAEPLQEILRSGSSSSDNTLGDHPIITDGCRYLIKLLSDNLENSPPPVASILRAFQHLVALSQYQDLPPRSSTPPSAAQSSPKLEDESPRAKAILTNGHESNETDNQLWDYMEPLFWAVNKKMQARDAAGVAEELEVFLFRLRKRAKHFATTFPNLRYFDFEDTLQRQECIEALSTAFPKLSTLQPRLSLPQQLHYLIVCLPLQSPASREDPSEDPIRQRLGDELRRTYQGDAHLRFLSFVAKVRRAFFDKGKTVNPYLKGTPIVQSSGAGKTRMVLELGRFAPLLFTCIRPVTATVHNGYPLGDKPMVMFLAEATKNYKLDHNEQAAVMLAAWFDTFATQLSSLHDGKSKFQYLVQLNEFGGPNHKVIREIFFDTVLQKARELARLKPPSKTYQDIFKMHLDPPVLALSKQMEVVQQYLAAEGSAATKHPLALESPPVFVAIDECVQLSLDVLDSVRRAWNHISHLEKTHKTVCFWLVLMSTNSSASIFVKPQHEHSSDRDKVSTPLPTFVGVGFDVLRAEQTPLQSASDVTDMTHIKKYGRPLWISLLEPSFWRVAVMKLQGTARFLRGSREVCFNVVASRLALRYVPIRGADSLSFGEQLAFAQKSVDRHMRVLVKVENDSSLHIRSPSEPVLAIAESLVMLPSQSEEAQDEHMPKQLAGSRYGSILETLKDSCLPSADLDILKGVRGELMARLMLMIAWDETKFNSAGFRNSTDDDWKATRLLEPVALESILSGLVKLDGEDCNKVRDQIKRVCIRNQERLGAKAEMQAWTHFTHFDILETSVDEISPEYLWYCWKRGVAIQMAHPQRGIDGIIPVFVGNLSSKFLDYVASTTPTYQNSEALAARHMTYIAWEAKNRSKTWPKLAQDDADKAVHAGPILERPRTGEDALTRRGLLTVLTDMGASYGPPLVSEIADTESLQVWIRGVDNERTYPCLEGLGLRDVVVEFLRSVSEHDDHESDNAILNPMDLGNAYSHVLDDVVVGQQFQFPSSAPLPGNEGLPMELS